MAEAAKSPVPEGMHTITTQFFFNGNCKEAVEFYKKAFNAEQLGELVMAPDGKSVWHVMMQIGNSHIMMADAMPDGYEKGPSGNGTMSIWLYVDDCDASWKQAIDNGCTEMFPMMDAFWGDRLGKLQDPYGHCWAIASHKWIYTPEEMKEKQDEFIASM